MDAIKQLAVELLETEKRYLLQDKGEYSAAIVVVITPDGRYWEEVTFNDEDQKVEAYASVVARAKARSATAIITINTGRQLEVADGETVDDYWWGKLEADDCSRALTLTASGPQMDAWSLALPYRLENGDVELGLESEFQPARVGLLPNWP
jgi:hypothetical protein